MSQPPPPYGGRRDPDLLRRPIRRAPRARATAAAAAERDVEQGEVLDRRGAGAARCSSSPGSSAASASAVVDGISGDSTAAAAVASAGSSGWLQLAVVSSRRSCSSARRWFALGVLAGIAVLFVARRRCVRRADRRAVREPQLTPPDVIRMVAPAADSYDARRGWEDGPVVTQPIDDQPIKTLPLVFEEPKGPRAEAQAAAPPRRPDPGRAQGTARGARAAGLPGASSSSTHYFSRLVDDPDADDRPAGRPARRARRGPAAPPDDAAARPRRPTRAPPARRCGSCSTARSSSRC